METDGSLNDEELVCADCGALSPEWASINRGVLVCPECCSVHRNLGRTISQIKSLKKGAWHVNQLALVNHLHRSGANNIWEHSLVDVNNSHHKSKKKPVSNDPIIPKKESFVKAKYVQLSFAIRPPKDESLTLEDLNKQLWCCVRTSHVATTLRLLALGADPNYADPEKGNTCLHIAAKERQTLQVELLWNYGSDVAQRNADGLTPADIARADNNLELAFRLDELEFEVTDRFSMFLCGRMPEHRNNQHFLIPELAIQLNPHIKQFRSLLQNSSSIVLERLIQDVYDEIDRREVSIEWYAAEQYRIGNHQHVAVFLPPSQRLSATRNQLRQKLAKFDSHDFSQLIIDLLKEVRRRFYGLPLPPQDDTNGIKSNSAHLSVTDTNNVISESGMDENRDYDEVADTSLYRKSRTSNSTKRSSEPAHNKASVVTDEVNETSVQNIFDNNQSIGFDNYLELREKLCETTERLDSIMNTNGQLLKNIQHMQTVIECLQSDNMELRSRVDSLVQSTADQQFQQASLKRISSPTKLFNSVCSPTSDIGAIVLPTASMLVSTNAKAGMQDSFVLSKAQLTGRPAGRLMHHRQNSLTSPLTLTERTDSSLSNRKSSANTLPFSTTTVTQKTTYSSSEKDFSSEKFRNGSAPPRYSIKSTGQLNTDNRVLPVSVDSSDGLSNSQNMPTLKSLFNDEVFPDNLILETELLTGAIKSLLVDLQQQTGSNDANAVFHADSIGHHITRITRAIPPEFLTGGIQHCVNNMEISMSELSRKCLSKPLNTDETCHAAYDVAKAAKQLLVTVHSRSGGF